MATLEGTLLSPEPLAPGRRGWRVPSGYIRCLNVPKDQ